MNYDFDSPIIRKGTDSEKWREYGPDVLPLWVADMDFAAPEPVLRALHERISHGVFGYGGETKALSELICERMFRKHNWKVEPNEVVHFPGVITGFNLACQAFAGPGNGVLIQTPVYPPFLSAPANAGSIRQEMRLTQDANGRYTVDLERFEGAMDDATRVFLLCNPHNPVGRIYSRDELSGMAEACMRRGVIMCSDEIHGDLVFNGHPHTPIASLDAEIAQRTITLSSPSKTFNIPGLYCSYAIIQNADLRRRFEEAQRGLVTHGNLLGLVAGAAAYREGDEWLEQLIAYLQGNRDYLYETIQHEMPMLKMVKPEGTYLAWVDCREAGIEGKAGTFFLKKGRVALVDGSHFGKGGEGFVRINFGCARSVLRDALERMKEALELR